MANFRQQTGGTLGTVNACDACVIELILCYSATETGLCCGNPTQVTVFTQQTGSVTDLASATGLLYTESGLSNLAPNGYYSDDIPGGCGTP